MYELPNGTLTFYYMELALEVILQCKVNQLKDILGKSKGQIQYNWKAVQYIQSKEQFIDWKQSMGGSRRAPQKHYLNEMEVPGLQQLKGLKSQTDLSKV